MPDTFDITLGDVQPIPITFQDGLEVQLEFNVNPVQFPISFLSPPAAAPESADAFYEHTQGVANAVWVITHGLDKRPSVTVIASSGDEVEGHIEYDTDDQITLTFSAPFSGVAYLN